MKLFPESFVQNADKAVASIDTFLNKYKELGNTANNLDKAKSELAHYQADLDEATEKLKAFGDIKTKGQAWEEQRKSVKNYEQALDSVIKKSAEVNANKKNSQITTNEDYNNLTRLISLQEQYNKVINEGRQLNNSKGAKTNTTKSAVVELLQQENVSVQKLQRSYAGLRSAEASISKKLTQESSGSDKWNELSKSLENVRSKMLATRLAMNQLQKNTISQELTNSFGLTNFNKTDFSNAIQQLVSSARVQLQQLRATGEGLGILDKEDLASFDELIQKINDATSKAQNFEEVLQKKGNSQSKVNDLTKEVEKLEKAFNAFDADGKIDKLFSDLERLGISTEGIDKSAKGVENLRNSLLGINSSKAEELKREFEKTAEGIKDSDDAVNKMKNSLGNMSQATASLQQMNSEFDQLKSQAQYFFGLTNSFNLLKRAINGAYETVKKLDAAMTETAVVTDFSVADMWDQLPQYTKMAKELGATTEGAYQTAALYYQQGPILPAGT